MPKNFQIAAVGEREIVVSCDFRAPKSLVFLAHSSCEHMSKWCVCQDHEVTECSLDFRPGGKWSTTYKAPSGDEHKFYGEMGEIVKDEKIVRTFIFCEYPDFPSVETLTLTQNGETTTLRVHALHLTREARDGMMASGMEHGTIECWDKLDLLLEELHATV